MLKYFWVASNINHYYNNCAAKNTTTKTSRTYHMQMVDIFPNHPMLRCHALPPDNAKGRIARHLRVILWVLQEREIFQHEGCFNICFTDKIIRNDSANICMQVVFVFCSIQVNYSHTQQLLLLFVF